MLADGLLHLVCRQEGVGRVTDGEPARVRGVGQVARIRGTAQRHKTGSFSTSVLLLHGHLPDVAIMQVDGCSCVHARQLGVHRVRASLPNQMRAATEPQIVHSGR